MTGHGDADENVLDVSTLRILEIGDKPYFKRAFPDQTTYFSTRFADHRAFDSGASPVALATFGRLARMARDPALSLIVCHPTFYAPWHWRWLARALFDRRSLQGRLPLIGAFGPQVLRLPVAAPIAVVDLEDLPVVNRCNFFLLDRSRVYFKRELPVDHWRVFLKTGHANLPTARFRRQQRNRDRIAKLRPISLGLPFGSERHLPLTAAEKGVDVFFAGRVEESSSVRTRGLAELLALRERGVVVDIPERPLPPAEFYRRCAQAWLTWSPEGFGWECFRHYEAPACGSVPVISQPVIDRHRPLIAGEHAFYYDVEPGGLTRAILSALSDRPRLAAMARAAARHVMTHHTPAALAAHMVTTALGIAARDGGASPSAPAETGASRADAAVTSAVSRPPPP